MAKLVDLFTFNERIADCLEKTLNLTSETSEEGTEVLYMFSHLDYLNLPIAEIDKLVETKKIKDIKQFGGYEIRNSETGRFVRVIKSYVEIIAREQTN